MPVAVNEFFVAHFGDEVHSAVGIVTCGLIQQAALFFKALVQPGTTRCVQQTDHGCNDSAFLDEVELAFEDRVWVIVESQDEPSMHLHPIVLNLLNRSDEVKVSILILVTFNQALFISSFNANEYSIESGLDHQLH